VSVSLMFVYLVHGSFQKEVEILVKIDDLLV